MALLRPLVLGPLSELSRTIRLSGVVDGADVMIASISGNSPRVLVRGTPGGFNDRLTLPPGVSLRADDLIVAMQVRGADQSPLPHKGMTLAMGVQRAPATQNELSHVNLVSTPWECGRHLWVDGGTPGATAQVLFNGVVAGEGEFLDAEGARFALTTPVPHATTVSVRQSVPALGAGPVQDVLSTTLPVPAESPLPAPAIDLEPFGCQGAIHVARVFDGAEVVLIRSDGRTRTEVRAGFDFSDLWLPLNPPLVSGEDLFIRQEVDPLCKRTRMIEMLTPVQPAPGAPAPKVGPICQGDPLIHVEDLIPGAPVRILADGVPLDAQAPRNNTVCDFPVEQLLQGVHTVGVQQSQCGVFGPMTIVTVMPIGALGTVPTPQIVGPIFDCIRDIPLAGVQIGTIVQLFSERDGPISGFVACETTGVHDSRRPRAQSAG